MDAAALANALTMGNTDAAQKYSPLSYSWGDVPPSLHVLDKAIANRTTGRVNIVAIGDSLLEGSGASAYRNGIVVNLGLYLRNRYPTVGQGSADLKGGLDSIGAAWSIEGSLATPQDCIPVSTGTVNRQTSATMPLGMGRRFAGMLTGSTLTFPSVVCTGFDIEWSGTISGGSSFTYSIDGGAPVSVNLSTVRVNTTTANSIGDTVLHMTSIPADWHPGTQLQMDTSGTQETVYISSISGTDVTLRVALTASHLSGANAAANANGGYLTPVRGLTAAAHVIKISAVTGANLLGIDYFLNDESNGIHVYNSGHAGIRADQLNTINNADHWSQSVAARNPHAIFCDLMINDSGVQTPAQMITNFTALRARINTECANYGLRQPSWIHMVPYEIFGPRYAGGTWAPYVDAIHAWARADTSGPGGYSGIYVIDLGRRMPRTDISNAPFPSPTAYYVDDKVHPQDTGARVFADWISKGLPIAQ